MKKLDEQDPEPRGDLQLRVLAQPSDANANGDISGGWLVTQMDSAASIVANRIAKGRTATMAIGDMSFMRPIRVGSVVCCYTHISQVGKSSVRINIEVWSRMPEDEQRSKVTEAEFVYVAIDENRRIRSIEPRPPLSVAR
jgi:acyl-CoA thioesterase YciA